MYCVMATVAVVLAGALTFLVLPINEIVLHCIVLVGMAYIQHRYYSKGLAEKAND